MDLFVDLLVDVDLWIIRIDLHDGNIIVNGFKWIYLWILLSVVFCIQRD